MLCILHKLQGSLFYIFSRLHRIYRLLLVKRYFLQQFLQHLQNDVTFNPQIIYDLGLTWNLSGICLELTWN